MTLKPFFLNHNICLDPVGPHVLKDYEHWFANPRAGQKGQIRPRTREEISDWLAEIGRNNKNAYFSIRINGENIGHLGVRDIDKDKNQGVLDLFVPKKMFLQKHQDAILSWLRYFLSSHLNLKLLLLQTDEEVAGDVFREVGFKLKGNDCNGLFVYRV